MAKVFAFEVCLWYFECSAARVVKHFAFCVQFLDLCVKVWKNDEANLFLDYIMLWELSVIFQIWMEGHISRQRVCKINAALLNGFSNESKMSVCWCRARSDIDWPRGHWGHEQNKLRPASGRSFSKTNKQGNYLCASLWLRFCTCACFGFMTPTNTAFLPLLAFIY